MDTQNLPPRFRERSVKRFEKTILSLHASWPTPIVVNPAPLAKETFRSRLRDAVRAISEGWACEHLQDKVKAFELIYRIQETDNGMLLIGHPNDLKLKQGKNVSVGTVVDGFVTIDDFASDTTPTGEVIKAMVVLLQAGFLSDFTLSAPRTMIDPHLPENHHYEVVEKDGRTTVF